MLKSFISIFIDYLVATIRFYHFLVISSMLRYSDPAYFSLRPNASIKC